jgi:hypothetical protein
MNRSGRRNCNKLSIGATALGATCWSLGWPHCEQSYLLDLRRTANDVSCGSQFRASRGNHGQEVRACAALNTLPVERKAPRPTSPSPCKFRQGRQAAGRDGSILKTFNERCVQEQASHGTWIMASRPALGFPTWSMTRGVLSPLRSS